MRCVSCGFDNRPTDNFCAHCGTSLRVMEDSTDVAEGPCRSCGGLIPVVSKFCGNCGVPEPFGPEDEASAGSESLADRLEIPGPDRPAPREEEVTVPRSRVDHQTGEVVAVAGATSSSVSEVPYGPKRPIGLARAPTSTEAKKGSSPIPVTEGWPDITDELAEIRFYVLQGLEEDAEAALAKLRARHPGHPELENTTPEEVSKVRRLPQPSESPPGPAASKPVAPKPRASKPAIAKPAAAKPAAAKPPLGRAKPAASKTPSAKPGRPKTGSSKTFSKPAAPQPALAKPVSAKPKLKPKSKPIGAIRLESKPVVVNRSGPSAASNGDAESDALQDAPTREHDPQIVAGAIDASTKPTPQAEVSSGTAADWGHAPPRGETVVGPPPEPPPSLSETADPTPTAAPAAAPVAREETVVAQGLQPPAPYREPGAAESAEAKPSRRTMMPDDPDQPPKPAPFGREPPPGSTLVPGTTPPTGGFPSVGEAASAPEPEASPLSSADGGTVVAANPLRVAGSPSIGEDSAPSVHAVRIVMLGAEGQPVAERVLQPFAMLAIGRDPSEPWGDDEHLAPEHAKLTPAPGGGVRVNDFAGAHPVFRQIEEQCPVTEGDEFRIGQSLVEFVAGEQPALRVQVNSHGPTKTHPLEVEGLLIGRDVGDIQLPEDTFISAEHCRFTRSGDGITLTDLGSSNGTYIRVRTGEIVAYGSLLLLGHTQFEIQPVHETDPGV